MIHELKTWPAFFECLDDGSKTFEVRRDDRGYQAGDTLVLREWEPNRHVYTGRELRRRVGFIFRGGIGLDLSGYVVMSLLPEESGSA